MVIVDGEVIDFRYLGRGTFLFLRQVATFFGDRVQLCVYSVREGVQVLDNFAPSDELNLGDFAQEVAA